MQYKLVEQGHSQGAVSYLEGPDPLEHDLGGLVDLQVVTKSLAVFGPVA